MPYSLVKINRGQNVGKLIDLIGQCREAAVLLDDAEFDSCPEAEAVKYPGGLILALHAMK